MKRQEKREQLIEVAARVFNRLGYHGAGVDHVIAEAGIAKTTLYRHFESKEDLIVAVLRRVDERFREDLRRAVEARASEPIDKILASFDFLEAWFNDPAFYGCPFISAAAEYAEGPSPVFREAALHKRLMIAYFEELARGAALPDPRAVAEDIHLLHEGAVAVAHVSGDTDAARRARRLAEQRLRSV